MESSKVVREGWNGYNVLHDSASRVAALDIGFLQSVSATRENPKPKFVYLLGSDDFNEADVPSDAFVVYQVAILLPGAEGLRSQTFSYSGPKPLMIHLSQDKIFSNG